MHVCAVQGSTRYDSSGHAKTTTAPDLVSKNPPGISRAVLRGWAGFGGQCAPKRLTLGKQEASQQQQDKEQEGAAGAGNCLVSGKGANGAEHGDTHAVHEGQQQHKGEEPRRLGSTASLQAATLEQVTNG